MEANHTLPRPQTSHARPKRHTYASSTIGLIAKHLYKSKCRSRYSRYCQDRQYPRTLTGISRAHPVIQRTKPYSKKHGHMDNNPQESGLPALSMSSALRTANKRFSDCRKSLICQLACFPGSNCTSGFTWRAENRSYSTLSAEPAIQSNWSLQDGTAFHHPPACHAPKQGKLPGLQGSFRAMSTGGISGKEYMWAIREEKKKQSMDEQSTQQREAEKEISEEIPFSALLNQAGYADVHDALQRVLIGAYQLLQKDQVDQAEYLVAEGAKTAQSSLQVNDSLLAQVRDQLALLQYLQGRYAEAKKNAVLSLAAVRGAGVDDDGEGRVADAMCSLRLGIISLAQGRQSEASQLLDSSINILKAALGGEYEPLSEANFHATLASLPQPVRPSHLTAVEPSLLKSEPGFSIKNDVMKAQVVVQDLLGMSRLEILGPHLARAAFREHGCLMDAAVEREDWPLAECILQQAIRLQEAVSPDSEELALTTYQYATLQYVRGSVSHGLQLCNSSLDLSRRLYKKDSSNQVALRLHRLGTLHLLGGDPNKAMELLEKSCNSLVRNVGDENPLAGESRAALALSKLKVLDDSHPQADPYTRVLNPGRREKLVAEAAEGLAHMQRGFGAKHMLVVVMRKIKNDCVLA